jgi:glycerol-3-phosphate acyltransferase PlsY
MPYFIIISAYLIGSLSTAIITCQLMGLDDPRTVGSNNPGATNVLRIGGKKAAFFTLLGDVLKGLLPVLVAAQLGLSADWLILVGIAAFLGHLYPLYYQFKGGKGVATAIGVFLGIHFGAGLAVVATWLIIAKGFKISSLAALIAIALSPLYFYLFTESLNLSYGLIVMAIFIFWRHRSNIQNLIHGTEGKIKADDE